MTISRKRYRIGWETISNRNEVNVLLDSRNWEMIHCKNQVRRDSGSRREGRVIMVSIKDVAKHAGVAISTVSKVLNHYPNVSEETRIKP